MQQPEGRQLEQVDVSGEESSWQWLAILSYGSGAPLPFLAKAACARERQENSASPQDG